MDWQNFYVLLLFGLSTLLVGLAFIGWQRRGARGSSAFILLALATAIWSACYALELLTPTLTGMISWAKLQYLGTVTIPVAWLIFAARYSGRGRWLSRRMILFLWNIPALTLALALTNEWHRLIWQEGQIGFAGPVSYFLPVYGPAYVIHLIYSTALLALGSFFLLRLAIENFTLYRLQALAVLATLLPPILGSIIDLTGTNPLGGLLVTPPTLAISSLVMAVGLLRLKLLDIAPVSYDSVIETIPDGIVVLDAQNRILAVNQVGEGYLKMRQENATGKTIDEIFPDSSAPLPQFLQKGEGTLDLKIEAEKWAQVRVVPLTSRAQGRVLIFQDISGQKQAEAEQKQRLEQLAILRQVDEEITSTLKISHVLIVALDAALRLSGAEAGFIALKEGEETRIVQVIGDYPPEVRSAVIHPDRGISGRVLRTHRPQLVMDVSQDPDYMMSLARTKAQMVLPLISQDQFIGLVTVETAWPNHFDENKFEFMQILIARIAIAIDNARLYAQVRERLAETQELYEKVSGLERLKTDMIRVAAHDLRNPIGVISGYISMMHMEELPESAREFLAPMDRAVKRSTAIIKDILSLERIEEMAKNQDGRSFDLCEQVKKAVAEYQERAAEKSQSFDFETNTSGPLQIHGDAAHLYEAVTNLIGNAIKYTPDGGQIQVRLRDENGVAHFEVQDTGYGIPQEMQADLFRPFYRAVTDETAGIEGTGLGLHLVKKIIERHDGHLTFESEKGKGSIFRFKIPTIQVS